MIRRNPFPWMLAVSLILMVGYFVLDTVARTGRLIYVPSTHDPRIVGTWHGEPPRKYRFTKWKRIEYVFRADGSAREQLDDHFPRSFGWGTERGEFVIRRVAEDAWVPMRMPYSVDSDGRTLRLLSPEKSIESSYFPQILKRRSP